MNKDEIMTMGLLAQPKPALASLRCIVNVGLAMPENYKVACLSIYIFIRLITCGLVLFTQIIVTECASADADLQQ